jgi:putative MATE family efflux protein
MISQNLMGLIDTALIGHLGTKSLAAAGISIFILFVHAAPLMGLAIAVQSLTANKMGANQKNTTAYYLNNSLIISLIYGGLVYFLSTFYLKGLVSLMTSDIEVIQLAYQYLDARLMGVFAIGLTHSYRGFWNGISRTNIYLMIIIIMHILNAIISYALIFGKWGFPNLGIAGAGFGSTIATLIGSLMHFLLALKTVRHFGYLKKFFNISIWKELVRQSSMSGMQQLLFALGFAVFFFIIGKLGAKELAAANVLITISLFMVYPGMAMGMTACTFVGESLGKGDRAKAKWWAQKVQNLTALCVGIISLICIIFHQAILEIFIHEVAVLELAKWPLIIFLITLNIEISGHILMYQFFGSGNPQIILGVTVPIQWIGILPFAYLIGPILGHGLTAIWLVQTVFRCLQTVILAWIWKRDQWSFKTS